MESHAAREHESFVSAWRMRMAVGVLLVLAVITVSVTNKLLTDRFTESTRNRAELRLALYGGNLLSELRQNAIVPQLLALLCRPVLDEVPGGIERGLFIEQPHPKRWQRAEAAPRS